jgi:hypothetical protein
MNTGTAIAIAPQITAKTVWTEKIGADLETP